MTQDVGLPVFRIRKGLIAVEDRKHTWIGYFVGIFDLVGVFMSVSVPVPMPMPMPMSMSVVIALRTLVVPRIAHLVNGSVY